MNELTPEIVAIKRYPNRRLYDRLTRKYVTLQDIESMVLKGKKVEVRDSKTGEDLTRTILTQLLLERHPEKMELVPVALLHNILRANDLMLEFFRSNMRQTLAILEGMQQAKPVAPFLGPVDWMRAIMPGMLPYLGANQTTSPAAGPSLPDLAERIAAIEDRIRHLEPPAPDGSPTHGPLEATVEAELSMLDQIDKRLEVLETGN